MFFIDGGICDEGDIAERTAAHIGSKFHRLSLTQDDLVDNYERTLWHVEQPILDLNAVGKFLLSEYVRHKGFKVIRAKQRLNRLRFFYCADK